MLHRNYVEIFLHNWLEMISLCQFSRLHPFSMSFSPLLLFVCVTLVFASSFHLSHLLLFIPRWTSSFSPYPRRSISPFLFSLIPLTSSVFFWGCLLLRRWIRRALVRTVSRWVSGPRRRLPTRSHPSPSWTSRPPPSQVTPRPPASSWSGTSRTATGRRSPPTPSPWTTRPLLWNQGQVTLSRACSQTPNTGTEVM